MGARSQAPRSTCAVSASLRLSNVGLGTRRHGRVERRLAREPRVRSAALGYGARMQCRRLVLAGLLLGAACSSGPAAPVVRHDPPGSATGAALSADPKHDVGGEAPATTKPQPAVSPTPPDSPELPASADSIDALSSDESLDSADGTDATVSPAAPVAPSATLARLAQVSVQLGVVEYRDAQAPDPQPEPPAALLPTGGRSRRPSGETPLIVRSPDGLDVWAITGDATSHYTMHAHLRAPAPPGTRLWPVYDFIDAFRSFALVDTATHQLLIQPWVDGDTLYPVEAAPGSPTDAAAALDATLELRWLQSCPTSRAECFLFGPPDAVASAVDPVRPPGDWSMGTSLLPVPTPRALAAGPRRVGEGVQVAVVSEGHGRSAELHARCGVWADLGAGPVEVMEIGCGPRGTEQSDRRPIRGGIFASGDLRVVWVWEVEAGRLHFAQLDALTGAHRAPPRTATAESYEEQDCADVWASIRPLPVLDGTRIGIGLALSESEALYFNGRSERGRLVGIELPAGQFDDDDGATRLPPVFRLGRCGGRRCLQPAE